MSWGVPGAPGVPHRSTDAALGDGLEHVQRVLVERVGAEAAVVEVLFVVVEDEQDVPR